MKLHLKTLTPVFIGSNDSKKLSPYSDYVQVDNKIKIIDNEKLSALLSKDLNIVDEYVDGVMEMEESKTRSKFDLESFINNKLKIDIDEILKEEYDVIGNTGKSVINTFIDSSGRYFIPGSSLKGAFRTALYYYWLEIDENGKSSLKKFTDLLIKRKKLEDGKNEGKKLNELEFAEFKNLSNDYNFNKEVKKVFDETLLFGKNEDSDSKYIRFSDSLFIEKNNFSVLNSSRTYLVNEDDDMPIWNIALMKDSSTQFEFSILEKFKNNFLNNISLNSINHIYEIINNFSLGVINYEIAIIEGLKNDALKTKLSGVKKYYENLRDIINKSNNNFCILRLGAGKTYYDNSIGLLILKLSNDGEDIKDIFDILRKYYKIGKVSNASIDKIFPITRSFYNIDGALYPPGWVAIGNEKNISNITFDIEKTVIVNYENKDTEKPEVKKAEIKKNYLIAEIIDAKSVPPKIKIIEGDDKDKETIMPKVNLENLGLTEKSVVYVVIEKDKRKNIIKAEYKGKADNDETIN